MVKLRDTLTVTAITGSSAWLTLDLILALLFCQYRGRSIEADILLTMRQRVLGL